MSHFKEILVATDFSDSSIKALQVARELGIRLNARLNIIHFVPTRISSVDIEGMETEANYIEQIHQTDLKEADKKLQGFIQIHTMAEDDIIQYICTGEPEDGINTKAREIGADMICMGTHGRSGLKHLLMGSVAENVLKSADIPVLCIRSN
jgi:nucleotide-binding universal stress UspA family protein